jgi:hypothetical protein
LCVLIWASGVTVPAALSAAWAASNHRMNRYS